MKTAEMSLIDVTDGEDEQETPESIDSPRETIEQTEQAPETEPEASPEPPVESPENVVEAIDRHLYAAAMGVVSAGADDDEAEPIVAKQQLVANLSIFLVKLKAAEKQIKDKLEDETANLMDLHQQRREAERRKNAPAPLFDDPALRQPATPPRAPEAEAWRSVLIADLTPALKPGKLKALAEHEPPILTMGDMADHQERAGDFWAKNIKGFGEGGQEQYAAASDAYWAANPIQTSPPAGERWPVVASDDSGPVAIDDHLIQEAADLGLEDFDFSSACRPGLLTGLQAGKTPEVGWVLEVDDSQHIVVSEPLAGIFRLKQIAAPRSDLRFDQSGDHADAYVGGIVLVDGREWQIQPMKYDLYIRAGV